MAAAGWNVRKYFWPAFSTILPLFAFIELPPRREEYAVLPSMQITFGFMSAICLSRYGLHATASSSSGTLLFGGLHFTTFVMNTCDLSMPAFSSRLSRTLPAAPTNGLPFSSSLLPGASPTNIILAESCPSPGTAFFLVLASLHSGQPLTSASIFSSESCFCAATTFHLPDSLRNIALPLSHKSYNDKHDAGYDAVQRVNVRIGDDRAVL